MIELKSPEEIDVMRQAGKVVGGLLRTVYDMAEPGVTTKELDEAAHAFVVGCNAKPAFLGYRGFPGTICTSINEEIVHGIPSNRKLKEGDILSVDAGSIVGGFYGDAAFTKAVGKSTADIDQLLKVTQESLFAGIDAAVVGNRLSDISFAVQQVIEKNKMGIVREFVGHGIGRALHEDPPVPNFGTPGTGPRLREGMVLAIEPMVTLGSPEVEILNDGWTAVTKDKSLSAHFEHSVAITERGPEILTAWEDG